jgi:hypothetical protein
MGDNPEHPTDPRSIHDAWIRAASQDHFLNREVIDASEIFFRLMKEQN